MGLVTYSVDVVFDMARWIHRTGDPMTAYAVAVVLSVFVAVVAVLSVFVAVVAVLSAVVAVGNSPGRVTVAAGVAATAGVSENKSGISSSSSSYSNSILK